MRPNMLYDEAATVENSEGTGSFGTLGGAVLCSMELAGPIVWVLAMHEYGIAVQYGKALRVPMA